MLAEMGSNESAPIAYPWCIFEADLCFESNVEVGVKGCCGPRAHPHMLDVAFGAAGAACDVFIPKIGK